MHRRDFSLESTQRNSSPAISKRTSRSRRSRATRRTSERDRGRSRSRSDERFTEHSKRTKSTCRRTQSRSRQFSQTPGKENSRYRSSTRRQRSRSRDESRRHSRRRSRSIQSSRNHSRSSSPDRRRRKQHRDTDTPDRTPARRRSPRLTPPQRYDDIDNDRNGCILPEQAKKIMRDGFRSYISLANLTTKSCTEQKLKATQPETISLVKGELVSSKVKGYNNDNEKSLAPYEWQQATNNLVRLIQDYYIPLDRRREGSSEAKQLAAKYKQIFGFIAERRNFVSDFEVFVNYTCEVMRIDVDRRVQEKTSVIHIFRQEWFVEWKIEAMRSLNSSSSTSSSSQPPRAKLSRLQSSFRSDGKKVWIRFCHLCGGNHPWKEHRSSHGKHLHKKDGKWKDADGNQYCIEFNTADNCKKEVNDSHPFKHWCSLCGGKDHGACNCPSNSSNASSST